MLKIHTFFITCLILFLLDSIANAEKINDIHNFLTSIDDHELLMETYLRVQYNSILGDKVKTIGTLMSGLKNLQKDMPADLDKYQSVELGLQIIHAINELINAVRENVLYSVRSYIDDGKIDHSDVLYNLLVYMDDFIENVKVGSKNLFNDGKGCVMEMEADIKAFIDLAGKRFIDCFKTVGISNPITPPNYQSRLYTLTYTVSGIAYKLKQHFWYTWMYSTRQQNETTATNFNTYCQTLFPITLDISKKISELGLDVIKALDNNNDAFMSCFNRVNATVIDPKKHELLNKILDVCSME